MNQFEFSRPIPFGQTCPLPIPLAPLRPQSPRMIAYFLLVMGLTFTRRIEGIVLGLVIVLVLLAGLGRIPYRFALQRIITPAALLADPGAAASFSHSSPYK